MRWRRMFATGICVVSVAVTATGVAAPGSPARPTVSQLKIMNYYPATAAWSLMWSRYSHARTARDFAAIRALGANTVRIIVQPQAVGYPIVRAPMRWRLRDMLSLARAARLSVQLTLFDWWSSYGDIAGSKTWLTSLLTGEAGDPTIALVELQNELPTSSPSALTWAEQLLPFLSRVLPGVPRTISASGASGVSGIAALASAIPVTELDVIDVHFYGDPSRAQGVFAAARAVAGTRPVIVGEAGQSTAPAGGDQQQADFYRVVGAATRSLGLPPPAPWILSDIEARAVPAGHVTSRAELSFGLRRTNGTWKPAAAVVRSNFGSG